MSSGEAAKAFDAYEIVGVVTPGSVVALLLMMQWPDLRNLIGQDGLSVGDFGFFVVIAFVLGHLTQAVGNWVEAAFWWIPGMPSGWVRTPGQKLVSPRQRLAVESKVAAMEGVAVDISALDRAAWANITKRMFARVRTAGRSARIDTFNRTYGMLRGLSAAFLMATAWLAFDKGLAVETVIAALFALIALMRMHRFGVHYARALILEFADL